MTEAEIDSKRDALISKIAAATKRLQAGDTSIEYQDVAQMQRALGVLDAEKARVSGTSTGSWGVAVAREGL